MKKLLLAILLISSPAWAQTKPLPKGAATRADNCTPIGRTEDGKLLYSMKCENLPAPPPPPPLAETRGRRLRSRRCSAGGFSAGPMRERDRANSNAFPMTIRFTRRGTRDRPLPGAAKDLKLT